MRRIPLAITALALLASACAAPEPVVVSAETTAQMRGVIEIIDPVTRQVVVRGEDGRAVTVTLPPEARNFDQLKPGDRVAATYAESVAARMATPDDRRETVIGTAAGRAPVGAAPGAAAGMALTSVVTWVGYDSATMIATFTGPTGLTHSVAVPAEMRAFAAARRPGDLVAIDYSEAMAIGVEKIGG